MVVRESTRLSMVTHYFTSDINPQLAYVATLYFKTPARNNTGGLKNFSRHRRKQADDQRRRHFSSQDDG